ncbi:MAG: hypothetical protein H7Z21_06405 [Hymenobacter sp.]|nr:hypothetical protein [Hymenobacter sp.]
MLIEPALDHDVPLNRVMALAPDQRPYRLSLVLQHGPPTDDGRAIHRCGFCGTFTDAHGHALTGDDLILHTRLLKTRGWPERPQHLVGHCCRYRQYSGFAGSVV